MEKTATLNLRVNPIDKQNAEKVLKQLGIPMATAINMFLRQITLTQSIPFKLELPKAPNELILDGKSLNEVKAFILQGYSDIEKGKIYDIEDVLEMPKEKTDENL